MSNLKSLTLGAIAFAFASSFGAAADTVRTDAVNVEAMLVHDTEFGGCMARLSVDLRQLPGSTCGEWVSMDCKGDFLDPDTSARMFEAVQIAYLTNRQLRVEIDQTRRHNGHCVAKRIDIY